MLAKQTLKSRLIAAATVRTVFIALFLYLASVAVLTLSDAQVDRHAPGINKPDLTFGYTPVALVDIFTRMGAEGRQAYLVNLVIDSIMPVFFAAVVLLMVARTFPRGLWLLGIPPLAFMIFDLLENASFALMLARFPDIAPLWAQITSYVTMIKLSAFFIAMPTLILTGIVFLVGLLRSRLRRSTA